MTGKRFGQITRQCLITLFDRQRFPLIWTGLKEVEFLWFLLHFPCVFLWDHLVIYLEWRYYNLKLKRQKVSVDKLSVCGLACEYSRLLFAPATACETRGETKGKNENTHMCVQRESCRPSQFFNFSLRVSHAVAGANVRRLYSQAKPLWVMSNYMMFYKYGKRAPHICGGF